MFGISVTEMMVVLALALVVFGPQKLPEIASSLGKLFGELRKHSNELRREFYNSVYVPTEDLRNSIQNTKRQLKTEAQNIVSDNQVNDDSKPEEVEDKKP